MKPNIALVVPVYNDWECLEILIQEITTQLGNLYANIYFIIVNDCSTSQPLTNSEFANHIHITQLDLVANLGSQRAILIGLCYLFQSELTMENIVILDSDGEDKPEDILHLINRSKEYDNTKIIFAKRSKRSEGIQFRFFYSIYKLLFHILTGNHISFGNFSCLTEFHLSRICNSPNFWNHYSSAVMKSNIPYESIATDRGRRYCGESKMNVSSLILHGLSALSVYMESIIVRLLYFSFIAFILLIFSLAIILYIKYFTAFAIPGWSSFLFAIIFNMLLTMSLFNLIILLFHLHNRKEPIITPLSFYKDLIEKKL